MTGPRSDEIAPLSAAEAAAKIESTEPAPAPRSGIRGLIVRFEHILRELGKFGTVGIVAFLVDFAIFNGLLALDLETLVAATVSMVLAATVAFVGNRFWTWRDRERSGLRREYTLYFIFNLIGLLMALGCLALTHYGLGAKWPWFETPLADNLSKIVLGTALGTTFRFWAYRKIVFRPIVNDNP